MRDYELILVIAPGVADGDVTPTVDKVTQWVVNLGGAITEVNPWGRRRLAYPIGKATEGLYVQAQLKLDAAHSSELDASLKASGDILRYLLVRVGD